MRGGRYCFENIDAYACSEASFSCCLSRAGRRRSLIIKLNMEGGWDSARGSQFGGVVGEDAVAHHSLWYKLLRAVEARCLMLTSWKYNRGLGQTGYAIKGSNTTGLKRGGRGGGGGGGGWGSGRRELGRGGRLLIDFHRQLEADIETK